jgi:hypothetical protein
MRRHTHKLKAVPVRRYDPKRTPADGAGGPEEHHPLARATVPG